MPRVLNIDEFLIKKSELPIFDVRSESEFKKGHIPGAYNLPLFNDLERAEIGTLYKKDGKEKAIIKGLEIVGPKMAKLVQEAKEKCSQNEALLYCWRGGMRSGSLAWLLETCGIKTFTLKNGYKNFRNKVLLEFEREREFLILGGKTGSRKTYILQYLKDKGEQIIDLEGLANHKGSSFGGIWEKLQPTTEYFENLLFEKLIQLDASKPIWLEDESRSLGTVFINLSVWQKMRSAKVLCLEIPIETRVKNLIEDYTIYPKVLLQIACHRLEKRLGNADCKLALIKIQTEKWDEAAEIFLKYYDKSYAFGLSKREKESIIIINDEGTDLQSLAQILIDTRKK